MPIGSVAIAVSAVDKTFVLPHQRRTTLKERVLHPFVRELPERLQALDAVSFRVERGELLAIMGRNGSGKSTLLRCLAGIYPIDHGTIEVEGRIAPFIELGVGFNAELPARDNVIMNSVVFGLTHAEAERRVDDILAFAELEAFADQKLKNFSTGMGVRLAFACTVNVDADVFLFDEVLAVGDAAFAEKCRGRFVELRRDGKTIVLVTHDPRLVTQFADRALLLHQGRLVETGAPETIVNRYAELNERREPGMGAASPRPRPRPKPMRFESLFGVQPRRFASLVRLLSATDFKLKYLDAKLSYVWAVGQPLARFGVMLLVFTHLGRFDRGVADYPVYLLMSIVLWTFYAQATQASVRSLVRREDFLRKVPFPHLAVPFAEIAAALIDLVANLVVVFVFVFAYGLAPRFAWLELLPIVGLLALFATGLAMLLSALFVRYRDLDQVWAVVLQTSFYCTPIFYAASSVPGSLQRVLVLVNPVATGLTQARQALIDPAAPTAADVAGGAGWLLVPIATVLGVLALGVWVFSRESPAAAESV